LADGKLLAALATATGLSPDSIMSGGAVLEAALAQATALSPDAVMLGEGGAAAFPYIIFARRRKGR